MAKSKLNVPNYAVLDFETSGLSQDKSKANSEVVAITQVAVIILNGSDLSEMDRYSSYILPYDTKLEYQDGAAKFTGITKDKLWEEGKDLKTVFKEFSDKLNEHKHSNIHKSILVGQNVTFDVDFLLDGYRRIKMDISKYFKCTNMGGIQIPRYIDTMDLGFLSNPSGKHNMAALCDYYGIDYIDGHDAMNDVMITSDVFRAQVERLRSSNILGEQTEVENVRQSFEWM